MKTKFKFLMLFSLVALISFNACDKDDNGDVTEINPEEAKAEVSNAVQNIRDNLAGVMETEAMAAVEFMMQLEPDFGKSAAVHNNFLSPYSFVKFATNPTTVKLFKSGHSTKEEDDIWGVWEYDFVSGEFIKINEHYLLIIYFPANQAAYDTENNNGVFELTELELTEVQYWDDWDETYYTEMVPIAVSANIEIDSNEVFSFSFNATWQQTDQDFFPQSLSASFNMPPYSINMNFSGNNRDYNASMSFKENSTILADANIQIKLTTALWDDEPEKISGHLQVTPLKAIGFVNLFAVEQAVDEDPPNVDLMNQNIDVELWQTELNAKLGHLEAKMFVTDDYEDIEPVLVYSDGSWQKLEDILQPIIDDIEEMIGEFDGLFDDEDEWK